MAQFIRVTDRERGATFVNFELVSRVTPSDIGGSRLELSDGRACFVAETPDAILRAVAGFLPSPQVPGVPPEQQMRDDLRDVGLEDMPLESLFEVWLNDQRGRPCSKA